MSSFFDRWLEGCNYQGGTWKDSDLKNGSFTPGSWYAGGYGTSVIGNKTLEWIDKVHKDGPFMVYFAPHAPHLPSSPSEWYEKGTRCDNVKSPRTPDFNYTGHEYFGNCTRDPVNGTYESDFVEIVSC